MSGPDRSWTVAPALLWFVAWLLVALYAFDGGMRAVADRFTVKRGGDAVAAGGPAFAAKPPAVAEAGDTGDTKDPDDKPAPPVTSRAKIQALEDACLAGPPEQCKRWAMDGFYRAVADAKAKKLGRAVRVSWYGDSVIATDAIPGRLRQLMQGELGDGGPGFVYVVPPHRFCGHESINRSSGGGWTAHAISTTQVADGLYGVGGSTAETDGGRATIKLISGTASAVELYYLAQPHGGGATITADGKELTTVDTKNADKQPGYATASVPGGAQKFELTTTGRVRVFGIDLENSTGAVVDNLGVVSVNVHSFDANKAEHFGAEIGHRGADLVMIMIGANEAEWLGPSDRDTKNYAASYAKLLAVVRGARPDASCLVVSPTDQAEAKDGGYPSRPVMPVLVAAQRSAALSQGCAFYSTYDWMGGKGSAAKWFRRGFVGSDFQHLSRKGANKLSESLFGTLMAGYQNYATP
jgi:lysophospholipase L1-like esterase